MSKIHEEKMKEITMAYKKSLAICMKKGEVRESELMFYDSANDIQDYFNDSYQSMSEERRTIIRTNFALSCLEKKKANLIWKEYFFQVEKFWWMRYYTRSTFYRLRRRAIEEFLCLIE